MRNEKIIDMSSKNNDLPVLRSLINDPRATSMSIAKNLGLSSAGVGKIRGKLEREGVIRGYETKVNYDSLSLATFAIINIRITTKGWQYKGNMGIQSQIAKNPNIMSLYRIPGRDVSHVMVCAFRNVRELDVFLNAIQSQLSDYIELKESFVLSSDCIIKESRDDLLLKIIDEGEDVRFPEPILFGNIVGEDI